MIKVIDSLGEVHTIPEALWNSLSKMKNCKFRLAEFPVPKEVIEFKPTHAKVQQPQNEVEQFIKQKECCKHECEKKDYEIEPEVLQNTDETITGYENPTPEKTKRDKHKNKQSTNKRKVKK